jgi:predicted small metal-binding protein
LVESILKKDVVVHWEEFHKLTKVAEARLGP